MSDTAGPSGVNVGSSNTAASQSAAETFLNVAQVVFIDSAVADAAWLASHVDAGVLAVVLSEGQDGIAEIASWLIARGIKNLSGISIVGHGADGLMMLGNAVLDSATISQYQAELAAIGGALAPGGDLLLYGCDIGQDEAGVAFVNAVSEATGGATVAAASHIVGSPDAGGSFELDVNTGVIETTIPFDAVAQSTFADILPTAINQVYFTTTGAPGTSANMNRIEQIGVSGSTQVGTPIDLRDASQQTLVTLAGVAVDPATGKYFVVNSNASTANQILVGSVTNPGSLTSIFSLPATSPISFQIAGIAIDQPNQTLYFSVDANAANAGSIGIWAVGELGGTATQVVSGFSSSHVPLSLALDKTNNLVFFH